MAVFRVEKNDNYTVMSNYHLRDSALSLKAKGLLSQMLSLPDEWDFTLSGLARINKESKDAIRTAVQELEKAGYIDRRQTQDESGKFACNEYVIHEQPVTRLKTYEYVVAGPNAVPDDHDAVLDPPLLENPTTDNPSTGNPSPEKPLTENPTELNKDISSKDNKKKNKKKKKSEPEWKPERFAGFWEFYRTNCRGEARLEAVKAWDKLRPDDALINRMGKALQRQIRSPDWQAGIGIPYASTWLNNARWEDEPKTADRNRTVEQSSDEVIRTWI